MKIFNNAAIAVAVIALAGCGAAQDPNQRKAGKWETNMTLEKMEMTGMPKGAEAQVEQMKAAMKDGIEKAGSQEECISEEQAAKEDVSKAISAGAGADCNFTTNEVGDGKITVAGVCKPSGQEMDVTMDGTMTPEEVNVVMTMKAEAKSEGAMQTPGLDMKMNIVSKNVGACEA